MGKFKWTMAAAAVFILLAMMCYRKPKVNEVAYDSLLWDLSKTDSLLVDGNWADRQVGYVNLEQFLQLANSYDGFEGVEKAKRDSLRFVARDIGVFFGSDNVVSKRQNLQISVDGNSFTADVKKIDGVEYIYIPYHILVSLAGWTSTGN